MKRILRWGYALVMPLVIFCVYESIAQGSAGVFLFWVQHARLLALGINYLLFFMVLNGFQFIKRRGFFFVSQTLVITFFLVAAIVSRMKIQWRMEPLLPSDIQLVSDALNIGNAYIENLYLLLIVGVILVVGTCMGLIIGFRGQKRQRGMGATAVSLGLAIVFGGFYVCAGETQGLRGALREKGWNTRYSLLENARLNGSAFQTLEYLADHHGAVSKPQGYSDGAVLALASQQPTAVGDQRPNVILILGESIADVSLLEGLELDTDPLENIHRLQKENPSGTLTVESFGGGTLTAESAMLTGISVEAYIPHKLDSIPWRLRSLGYTSTAMHTYWGWFYDRQKDLRDLGFDLFMPLEALQTTPEFTPYPKDQMLYAHLLKRLKATESRDFIYAATMEAHGGYDYAPIYETPMNVSPLPEEAQRELNNYLTLQRSADGALGQLIKDLEAFSEPTVVIYFGDHYPAIFKTLDALGIKQDDPRLYETLYFVWANFPLDLPKEKALQVDRLTGTVLKALGLPMTLSQSLYVFGAEEDTMKLVKYDALYGKHLAAQVDQLKFDNKEYRIGLPPRVDSVTMTGDDQIVFTGENLSWRVIVKTETSYDLLILDTDGQTASAKLPAGYKKQALQNGGTLLFVSDNEKPFASCTFEAPGYDR